MTSPGAPKDAPKFDLVIEAGKAEAQYFLSWRDILVRYKQTVLGVTWAVIRPLVTMLVFTVIFGRIAKLPSEGVPYPVLVFAAMLPWMFFASALTESSNSLIGNANLVSKVYFPRLLVPTSSVVVCVVDFAINAVLIAGLMVIYGVLPTWRVLALPALLVLTFALAIGGGLWLAALNVAYRDFRHLVPFIVQIGLYISPVGFSSSVLPEQWRLLYALNPMVGVIDGFRWAICAPAQAPWQSLAVSVPVIAVLLMSGLWFFRRTERTFADTI
jgi:lipopolysaccharide transport system permease protein